MKGHFVTILLLIIFSNGLFAQNGNWTIHKLSEGVYRVQGEFAMELCDAGCCSICFDPTDQIYRDHQYLVPLNDILKSKFSYDTVLFFGQNIEAEDSTVISRYKLKDVTVDSSCFKLNRLSILTVYSRYMKRRNNKLFRYLGSMHRYNGLIYYQAFKCDFIMRRVKPEVLANISPQFKKPKRKEELFDTTKPVSYCITKIISIKPLVTHSKEKKWGW